MFEFLTRLVNAASSVLSQVLTTRNPLEARFQYEFGRIQVEALGVV